MIVKEPEEEEKKHEKIEEQSACEYAKFLINNIETNILGMNTKQQNEVFKQKFKEQAELKKNMKA